MNESPEIKNIIAELGRHREHYRYHGTGTQNKILTALIAPTAVGKSTIIKESIREADEQGLNTGEVGTLTTRRRRYDHDPRNYRTADEGITHELLMNMIIDGTLINWSVMPTGEMYATDIDSMPAEYNFMPLLPDSVAMLDRAGFSKLNIVYILAPVSEWAHRLDKRRSDPKFKQRMQEAISSLEFARENIDNMCIINNPDTRDGIPAHVAEMVVEIAHGKTFENEPGTLEHINAMLEYAQKEVDGNA